MATMNLLKKPVVRVINKFGYLTKQQCVDVSTNVGKELVDLSKQQVNITTETVQEVVRRHCPHVNVSFVDKQEVIDLLTYYNVPRKRLEAEMEKWNASCLHTPKKKAHLFT